MKEPKLTPEIVEYLKYLEYCYLGWARFYREQYLQLKNNPEYRKDLEGRRRLDAITQLSDQSYMHESNAFDLGYRIYDFENPKTEKEDLTEIPF